MRISLPLGGLAAYTVLAILLAAALTPAASADAEPVSCQGLQATLSNDKNYYLFRVQAEGNAASIVGYSFDFGDHQSYTFTFKPGATDDHHTATVTHTYQQVGTYTAKAQVVVKNAGKTSKITSESCKTQVSIEPATDTLPNTGTTTPLAGLFVVTVITGTATHYLVRRRRQRHGSSSIT